MENMEDMYKYPYLVNRDLEKCVHWQRLIDLSLCDGYGDFENHLFKIHSYNWSNENDPAPNFEFKPTGFKIEWYKHPFRASYMNYELSTKDIILIFEQCLKSVGGQTCQ